MRSPEEVKEAVIEQFRSEIAELRKELEPSEAGWLNIDMRTGADTTETHVEEIKGYIAEYERCIAALEKQMRDA
jgi:hypothetical protein